MIANLILSILGDKLYIVMELIEGVPLAEHFNSLKEKQQQITEDRIWNIFVQVTPVEMNIRLIESYFSHDVF